MTLHFFVESAIDTVVVVFVKAVMTPKSAISASASSVIVRSCPAPLPAIIRILILSEKFAWRLNPATVIVVDDAAIA